MTTSGLAAVTAVHPASPARASSTTASAPAASREAARCELRVVPTTWWPALRSIGTSRRPTAPVAPAAEMRLIPPRLARCCRYLRRDGPRTCDSCFNDGVTDLAAAHAR